MCFIEWSYKKDEVISCYEWLCYLCLCARQSGYPCLSMWYAICSELPVFFYSVCKRVDVDFFGLV